ncbi:unnamed protein product [Lupinus luteus]|uniref:Uncharacterized protein n=1 Tax=Lupinus luteus TaxID=3873 RepID=A0AAV1YFF0_LUPLU
MQQLAPKQTQPGHPAPSSQPIPMAYIQTNWPPVPPHHHMPGLAVSGAPSHSSYTFTPSNGPQHDNANASAQYQPPPQMLAPPAGQPWFPSVSQSASAVTSVQQARVQSSGSTSTDEIRKESERTSSPKKRESVRTNWFTAKKEKEREEKWKEEEKKEKDGEREKEKSKERHKKDDTNSEKQEINENHDYKGEKKKDKERKHRKRRQSRIEDCDSEKG